jgi:hypothetical protein
MMEQQMEDLTQEQLEQVGPTSHMLITACRRCSDNGSCGCAHLSTLVPGPV